MAREIILVVEDEEDIRELLRFHLVRDGYSVTTAASGEEALRAVARKAPNLVLLDLMLPGVSGLDVCRALKGEPRTRGISVVMVTARGEESDVVAGLELGADDYIVKPFSLKVLVSRVRAVLRRRQTVPTDESAPLRVHGIEINPGRHEVRVAGKPVEMTFSELRILHTLARQPGWVLTREQIVDAVRGADYAVTDRAVDVQIVGIRKKLGARADCIETVRGVGYRFRERE
jgi:two-component system phosphate regulon response regulator PhoB